MTLSTLPHLRDRIYGVEVGAGNYYAFFDDGAGNVVASYYNREAWVADRATIAVPDFTALSPATVILHDTGGKVGDGSLAWVTNDDAKIGVIDPSTGGLYEYSCAGFRLTTRGVGLIDGALYWIEYVYSDSTGDLAHGVEANAGGLTLHTYLMRANCDLTDVTELGSHDIDGTFPATFPVAQVAGVSGCILSSAALVANAGMQHNSPGSPAVNGFDVSFTLDGVGSDNYVAGELNFTEFGTATNAMGIAAGDGSAVFCNGTGLCRRADGLSGSITQLWTFAPNVGNLAAPVDGDISAYDNPTIYRGPLGSASSPTDTFSAEPHPVLGSTPSLMYAAI